MQNEANANPVDPAINLRRERLTMLVFGLFLLVGLIALGIDAVLSYTRL
jgi:hypothetical protein